MKFNVSVKLGGILGGIFDKMSMDAGVDKPSEFNVKWCDGIVIPRRGKIVYLSHGETEVIDL